MATAKQKKDAPSRAEGKGLKVIARPDSFRRAGREFGREPVVIAYKDLTDEQIDALTNETELMVMEVDIPAPPEETATK